MEPAPLLLLLLSSLGGCNGQPAARLAVTPQEPVVPYGGSAQLNCSLACTGGTVQWKGLDTNLGSITSFPTHTILHISGAVVAMAGTKVCLGNCHGKLYQHVVHLKVYALPERLWLEAEPHTLEPGQPGSLRCSARGIYPLRGLGLSWYRGAQVLEDTSFDATETDEELFDIESTLPVAGEEAGEGVEFTCKVTLSIGQETFTRVASVAVSTRAVVEQPVAVATSMGSSWTAAATSRSPSTPGPVVSRALPPEPRVPTRDPTTALTTTRAPGTETNLELAAATKIPSTDGSTLQDLITGSPTAQPATTALPGSGTATAVDSISQGSVLVAKGTGTPPGTAPACTLQIWSLPPNGTQGRALRIECHARCAGTATVRWLRTPVALSQYRQEVTGSSSALQLDHAEPWHQGHYQCTLLGQRSQVASLQLTVSDDLFGTGPAIAVGTTVSLLGLIVTSVTSRCLWKRFRSQYELP